MFTSFTAHLSLFSSFFSFDLVSLIKWAGVLGIALIVFGESGLLIGVFLPGDTLLFTAGFLVHTGFLPVDISVLVITLFVAAVLGDSTGYLFGRRVGRKLFNRSDSRLFKQEHVKKAEVFYNDNGPKTIIIARFIPFVRTFAPVIAGTAKMDYKTFLIFDVIGCALWAAGVTYLGFFLGTWFTSMGLGIDQVILPVVAIILIISIAPALFHIFKEKKQRDAFWSATKLEFSKVFKKK